MLPEVVKFVLFSTCHTAMLAFQLKVLVRLCNWMGYHTFHLLPHYDHIDLSKDASGLRGHIHCVDESE
jgi:hypothetical protein